MNILFSTSPAWQQKGIAIVRMIVGLLLIYHGHEVFRPELMKGYTEWDSFKGPLGTLLVYAGKGSELVAGLSLFLGLFTRIGCVLIIGTFTYITFILNQGRFWYEEQHPFMFLLFGVSFMFTGPGAWSLDAILFKDKEKRD